MTVEPINFNGFVHGTNLKNKLDKTKDAALKDALKYYCDFRKSISCLEITSKDDVEKLCKYFNAYRSLVAYDLESRNTSGQENLRSSMMEEFFVHLFQNLIKLKFERTPANLFIGKNKGYVDLTFSPRSFNEMFVDPGAYFHTKDQDFMFGVELSVCISSKSDTDLDQIKATDIIVPIVAIECKTYLERNMLDSCAGTATRLKKATPYCLYIVASEYLKLKDSQPELTDIDEVYVLCKESNSERDRKRKEKIDITPISSELIFDLFEKVRLHINKLWWNPDEALKVGKIINRP